MSKNISFTSQINAGLFTHEITPNITSLEATPDKQKISPILVFLCKMPECKAGCKATHTFTELGLHYENFVMESLSAKVQDTLYII